MSLDSGASCCQRGALRCLRLFSKQFRKGNSPKFVCRIVHTPGPIGSKTANRPGPAPGANPYMFWCRIKMRCREWEAARMTPRMWECAGHRLAHQLQY